MQIPRRYEHRATHARGKGKGAIMLEAVPEGLTADALAALSPEQREAFLSGLTDAEAQALRWDWSFWARPTQLPPPGNWRVWLLLSGRGFGKTRVLCEWVRSQVESGKCGRIGAIARTSADCRDVLVEGNSGLLAVSPPHFRPTYEPSKRRVTWPNGAICTLYSSEEGDALRGPEHDAIIADELAAWSDRHAWDMSQFGLRLGADPRVVAATTPRPTPLIRELVVRQDVHVTRGRTFDNVQNLPPSFLANLRDRYEGTRLGKQELEGELLLDIPGALWKFEDIQRVTQAPEMKRIVVAIDPAVSSHEDSDETGIVVCGIDRADQLYVLCDASMRGTPNEWASRAITLYHEYRADRVVAEINNGGDLVENTLRAIDRNVSFKAVRASRGKVTRAEPIAAFYERRKAFHVGKFEQLESQMLSFVPDMKQSPDRVDALVWGAHELRVF
jgi:phage terminase large subunit-like protein